MKGHLFHIQRFSLDDGPGIRTTVFFKGCNQSCIWCHNPESLNLEPEWMRMDSLCTRCGRCMEVCPKGAVRFVDGSYYTDNQKCIGCGKCREQCPQSALRREGYQMEAREVFRILEKDKAYYEKSGGGVTFSGGEPTLQGDFLMELLGLCKSGGIYTAIETNGNTPPELLERISPLLDEVLVDLKHLDKEKHKRFTGADNRRTLEAIKYYIKHNRTEIRIPVIPTFNNTMRELQSMLDFLAEAGAYDVTLLPYHTFGVSKYKNLGRSYRLEGHDKMETGELEELLGTIKLPSGLQVKIHTK